MNHILFFLVLITLFVACSNSNEMKNSSVMDTAYVPIKPKGMMDQLNLADSAVVIYYDQPANPRFFKVAKLRDLKPLQGLIEDVNGVFVAGFDDCQSLGKLYFYGKGDIVDVVYFSNNDACMVFSFIKNGEKHFTRMGLPSKRLIDSLRDYALAPKTNN